MTGTSIDGIDAALVRVRGRGLAVAGELVRARAAALESETTPGLAEGLRRLASQEPMSARAIAGLSRGLAVRHAEVVRDLLGLERCDLVCVHGQTVYHSPPISWQLLQPAPLARAIGAPVVCDLRQADLAVDGEGAPITPIADWALLRDCLGAEVRCVVNLGGFCNITVLPASVGLERVRAADVCACNRVLDEVARARLGRPIDRDGCEALAGSADGAAGAELRRLLDAQHAGRKSLGTHDELGAWVTRHAERLSPRDQLATACREIGGTIASAVASALDASWADGEEGERARGASGRARVLLAGGGVHNRALVAAIGAGPGGIAGACSVEASDRWGVPAQFREAMCFAVLGAMCADGVPICLPHVTRAGRGVLSGLWAYP